MDNQPPQNESSDNSNKTPPVPPIEDQIEDAHHGENQRNGQNQANHKVKGKRFWHDLNVSDRINFCIAVFTGGVFLYTIFSYNKTSESVSDQKQSFNISNTPVLAISSFQSPAIKVNHPHYLFFEILNLGNVPVHITSITSGFLFDTTKQKIALNEWTTKSHIDVYTNKEHSYSDNFLISKSISKTDSINFLYGNNLVYLRLEYQNDIEEKLRTYTLLASLCFSDSNSHICKVDTNQNVYYK